MKNVAGIFERHMDADNATAALMQKGFNIEDISILMSDESRQRHFHNVDTRNDAVAKGGAAGAALGGVLGAIAAALTVIGVITIPGIGLLAAGPIVAVLAGTGAGAAVGGLGGALAGAGFSEGDARHFEAQLEKGNIVMIVHTNTEQQILAASEVLRLYNATTEAV